MISITNPLRIFVVRAYFGISAAGFAASEIRIDRHRKITPTHDNAADPRRHEI